MGTRNNPNLHNPHLDGDAFFWQAGPVGVFLAHGYTATTAEIRPLAEKFHARGYSVAAPLLPGHGTRPGDLNRVRWREWAATGQATLNQLLATCEHVFVSGESMGGLVALHLASKNPGVCGVLLYAPAIMLNMGPLDYAKLYLGAPFMEQVSRSSLDCSGKWQGYPGLPLRGIIQMQHFQSAVLSRLAEIHQPVLVFQGRLDTTVAPDAGKIILDGVCSTVKEHYWMEQSHHTITLDVEIARVADLSIQFIEKNIPL